MLNHVDYAKYPFLISWIGKLHVVIETFLFVLFNPPNLDLTFPFVSFKISSVQMSESSFIYKEMIIGIFCFPVMWFLLFTGKIGKVNSLRNFIFASIFISLLNVLVCSFVAGALAFRYSMDLSWVLGLCSLVCAFCLFQRYQIHGRMSLKVCYIFDFITVILVFLATISYRGLHFGPVIPLDPKIWHYFARTFGVICNVPWS